MTISQRKTAKKILYLEAIPKKLNAKDPLDILIQLEALGKTNEDLIRIFRDINRYELAKLVEDSAVRNEKTPVDQDNSSQDVGLILAQRLCKFLEEQPDHRELTAMKTSKKTKVYPELPVCSGSPLPARGKKVPAELATV